MAVTRFSGRTAPPHPGGVPNFPDDVAQGLQPRGDELRILAREPRGAADLLRRRLPNPRRIRRCLDRASEDTLVGRARRVRTPYAAAATDRNAMLLQFVDSAHIAAADLLGWERDLLECHARFGADWWRQRGTI
ncbi:MAG: hypothetical protein HRT86_14280 [Ilumatobacteraceae bacterium]|nr:hypothetical protein [Ilumatobacteraceae bacterium]